MNAISLQSSGSAYLLAFAILVGWGGCSRPGQGDGELVNATGAAIGDAARRDSQALGAHGDGMSSAAAASEQGSADFAGSASVAGPSSPSSHEVADGGTPPAVADPPAAGAAERSQAEATGNQPDAPRREALFEAWPDPTFVLFLTGQQQGYIEPCGCTGLSNQKGGLVRRYSLKQQLTARGWEVVPLDVGNQVRRFGRQPEIKFQMTVEGLKRMGYRAIGFGPDDLRLSVGELVALTANDGQGSTPFVCANTAVIDPSLTPEFHVLEAGGSKIGVTAVLGSDEQAKITSDEIVKQSAEEALSAVWPQLEQARCDLYVLLAHASMGESIKLAQQFPHFDVVVTAGGLGEPTYEAERIPNTDSILVQVGTKGMHVGVVGVFDDEPRLRYQRVPLDARFPDSREMLDLLGSYQEQLKVAGLEGLGVKPIPHPSGRTFVGSDSCKDCHREEYDIWENTPHSWALDSLVHPNERSEVPRHFDPECLSCHVVGWNPQKYFPYVSGYLGLQETPLMHNMGCENCHGPGSAHNDAEALNQDQALLDQLRAEMRLPLAEAEKKCMECHDLDNSPDFHVPGAFERYWEEVEH